MRPEDEGPRDNYKQLEHILFSKYREYSKNNKKLSKQIGGGAVGNIWRGPINLFLKESGCIQEKAPESQRRC